MATNVTAKVVGGQAKTVSANTVQDAYNALGLTGSYTASVNGESAEMSDTIGEYSFVDFAEKVKGGC